MDEGQRIWVIGPPGSGKTTLSRKIEDQFQIPAYELDQFFWGPKWTRVNEAEFVKSVNEICKLNSWIIDGQYSNVSDMIFSRANIIIWMDIGMFTSIFRVVRRAIKGMIKTTRLWNGNKESLWRIITDFIPYIIRNHRKSVIENMHIFHNDQVALKYHVDNKAKYNEILLELGKMSYGRIPQKSYMEL